MECWWSRGDLRYIDGKLRFRDIILQDFASEANIEQAPAFLYSSERVKENLCRLRSALEEQNIKHEIFYAIKANRFVPLLTSMKIWGLCGIDVCSPNEMLLARQVGFSSEKISFTGNSVSNADLGIIARHPKVHINCDSISTIRRLGLQSRGRKIGIRINPRVGAGYHEELAYAGEKPTKFGIYPDRFLEALKVANAYDMIITQIHFHFGCGYLTHQLPLLEEALKTVVPMLDRCPEARVLDIGGGLGIQVSEEQEPLDLRKWAELIAKYVKDKDLTVHVEPGDYVIKDAGILLVQINTIEVKGGTKFVGVNAGFNIQNLVVYYKTPFIIAPLVERDGGKEKVTVCGHINEAVDIFGRDVEMSPLEEGDFLAFLNVGGYGVSSSSNHCMRQQFSEYLI